ncbi:helix-turn-helix domain-containing protein [Aliarcobacter butzleri]|uniref:helix-turn-helix domain-containing protein n=1 Tax=Aliarcobacter butzleri TaxID=28197 RepID=UPI003B210993
MNINEKIEQIMEDINLSGFANKINLNTREAAKVLGISLSSLEGMRRRSLGPTYLQIGKRVCYNKRSLAEYIMQSQIQTL